MLQNVWQRLDHGARLSLPVVTTLLCIFLSVLTWPVPYLGTVAPPLGLIAVYYWSLHRPDLFRPVAAFALGILNDIINYLPLGMTALLFVGIRQIILSQRRFFVGHSFFMLWVGFIITSFMMAIAQWVILSLSQMHLTPTVPILIQAVLCVAIFPIPSWLFIRLQRTALSQE